VFLELGLGECRGRAQGTPSGGVWGCIRRGLVLRGDGTRILFSAVFSFDFRDTLRTKSWVRRGTNLVEVRGVDARDGGVMMPLGSG